MSRVSRIGLPLSSDSSTASSREFFWTWRASAYKYRARTCPGVVLHDSKAVRAARTAASTSAVDACMIFARGLPVAGAIESKWSLPFTQALLTQTPNGDRAAIQALAVLSASGAGP